MEINWSYPSRSISFFQQLHRFSAISFFLFFCFTSVEKFLLYIYVYVYLSLFLISRLSSLCSRIGAKLSVYWRQYTEQRPTISWHGVTWPLLMNSLHQFQTLNTDQQETRRCVHCRFRLRDSISETIFLRNIPISRAREREELALHYIQTGS